MEFLSLTTILFFALLGSLAGFLAGLLGIGGGVILVPLFIWAFKVSGFHPDIIVHLAFGTSLAIIIPTALSSTFGHRKRGNVNWHHVVFLAAGGTIGAFVGATVASVIDGDWLKSLFGLMQIVVALQLTLFHPRLPPERDSEVPSWQLISVGFAGGAFSAFFGVGGGVVAVPLMIVLLQLPIHLAVGNSSALIVVSAVSGATAYLLYGWGDMNLPAFSYGYINILVAAIVAPFTIILARIGVRVAGRTSHDKLIRVFAIMLILVGLKMLYPALIALL